MQDLKANRKRLTVERVSEDALRRTAAILGPSSAAQKALDDLAYRRGRGEKVFAAYWKSTVVVLPEDCVVRN